MTSRDQTEEATSAHYRAHCSGLGTTGRVERWWWPGLGPGQSDTGDSTWTLTGRRERISDIRDIAIQFASQSTNLKLEYKGNI